MEQLVSSKYKKWGLRQKNEPEALTPEQELASIQAWNAYAAKNRSEWGLSHLNEICPVPLLSKGTNLENSYLSVPYHPDDARACVDIKVGAQDIVVKCLLRGGASKANPGGGVRQKITEWSRKSRTACELHIRNLAEGKVANFLTLTYPAEYSTDGRVVKKHLELMRKWLTYHGVNGVWFLEFQRRGAPHYHIFLDRDIPGGVEAVARQWFNVVGSGDEKHLEWHLGTLSGRPCLEPMRKPHAASWYASKYATKAEQKAVPPEYQSVGRFWGHWGSMRPTWHYLYGRGTAVFTAALMAIRNFRQERGIDKPMNSPDRYSSVLRGAMVEGFDWWFPDWCPF